MSSEAWTRVHEIGRDLRDVLSLADADTLARGLAFGLAHAREINFGEDNRAA